ncbi:maleylpyruvate isomerase N-terminal domain-containing protein [Cellulomonas sp. DKR-3]|uniref:Maleylpyruvate isomerase N-terminal domain-containing protein n=1 Tax=Cellulomonas fulva TaxID=2835530 RepID=A0ABS5TW15_9CELL|nr:maleylpyruvate isomerase N-terminal domain-containing protein [Cellulomonas fulva]MBT0993359.1 maleylpyruvate isomerase N-terminal domain-containing protein [Cellulomonas fulva]
MESWSATRTTFAEAAGWYVRTVARVGGRWEAPGLGVWDVRALVGHTSRSLLTVEQYLQVPATTVDVPSTAAYYRATRSMSAGEEVAERGRAAGRALGDDPADEVARIATRVVALLDGTPGTQTLTTLAGGMRLADYLPTRTFELVVHTLDLVAALGETDEPEPPAAAAAQALRVVADLAVEDGRAGALLLAATGRAALPPGFTVL